MDNIISKIQLCNHGVRNIIPIQSLSQFFSVIVSFSFVSIFMIFLIHYFEISVSVSIIIVGAFFGILPSLFFVIPAFFKINVTTLNKNGWLNFLKVEIERNWVQGENQNHYVSNLPSFLRWKENEIFITTSNDEIFVKGPLGTLFLLRKRLIKTL